MPRSATDSEGANVTDERRLIMLAVLRQHPGVTAGKLTNHIIEAVAAGEYEWPEAPWPGARQQPYNTGTYQNLGSMRHEDPPRVVYDRNQGWTVNTAAMRKGAEQALFLDAERRSVKEIAKVMGCGRKRVYSLLGDPYGIKERQRKKRYCAACGAKKTSINQEWCKNCRHAKADELLPNPGYRSIIEDYQHRTGLEVVFGVTEHLVRLIRIGTPRGTIEHILDERDTWDDAIEELELR